MKFLLDENIPPSLCDRFIQQGHDTAHIRLCGLGGLPDYEVIKFAQEHKRTIITHDLDFSRIVSLSGLDSPSVITLRHEKINSSILFESIFSQVSLIEELLKASALITIDESKIRYRALPVTRQD